MGPSYQGATVSLRLINFSAAMHLSGVQLHNIGRRRRSLVAAAPHEYTGLHSLKNKL